jgi:hypothetical protein
MHSAQIGISSNIFHLPAKILEFCFTVFFTQEWTPHFLRFYIFYTIVIPAAPQETVGEAGIESGTAVLFVCIVEITG